MGEKKEYRTKVFEENGQQFRIETVQSIFLANDLPDVMKLWRISADFSAVIKVEQVK